MHFRYLQKFTVGNSGAVAAGYLPGTLRRCSSIQIPQRPSTAILLGTNVDQKVPSRQNSKLGAFRHESFSNSGATIASRSKSVPASYYYNLPWSRSTNDQQNLCFSVLQKTNAIVNETVRKYTEKSTSGQSPRLSSYQKRKYSTFIERLKKFFNFGASLTTEGENKEGDTIKKEEATNPPETKKTVEEIKFKESQPKLCNPPDSKAFSMRSTNEFDVEGKNPPFKTDEGFFSEERVCKELPDLRVIKLQRDYELRQAELYEKQREEEIRRGKEKVKKRDNNENLEDKFSIVETSPSVFLLADRHKRLLESHYPTKALQISNDKKTVVVDLKQTERNLETKTKPRLNRPNNEKDDDLKETIANIRVTNQLNPIPRKTLARTIKIFVSERAQPSFIQRPPPRRKDVVKMKPSKDETKEEAVESEKEEEVVKDEEKVQTNSVEEKSVQKITPSVKVVDDKNNKKNVEEEKTRPEVVIPIPIPETVQKDFDSIENVDLLYEKIPDCEDIADYEPNKPIPTKLKNLSNFLKVDGSFETQMSKAMLSNFLRTDFQRTNTTECPETPPENDKKANRSNGVSFSVISDVIDKDQFYLNLDDLRRIEEAVRELEAHVAEIPKIVEQVRMTPIEKIQEIMMAKCGKSDEKNVEEETICDEKEDEEVIEEKPSVILQQFNLVKLTRNEEDERRVTPIRFFEDRKVKPIRLKEDAVDKAKAIDANQILFFPKPKAEQKIPEELDPMAKVAEIQFKSSEEAPEELPIEIKKYNFGDLHIEPIKEYKPKGFSVDVEMKSPNEEEMTHCVEIENDNEEVVIEEYKKGTNKPEVKNIELPKKELPQFNVYKFDRTKKDNNLGLKFFEGTPIPEDDVIINKPKRVQVQTIPLKEVPPVTNRKIITAEPMVYQVGGGHSLLCQIKNMQDTKMKNTMRESMRFMEQVREQLRWDFGDSYTKEVVQVNPDTKTSTTRILPHDPTTPYSQIYIKLNDFKIMSVQADARKKDGQTVRGLLKDQGRKLLCPFQTLCGVQKRDHNTVFQIPFYARPTQNEEDVEDESLERLDVIDFLTGKGTEEEIPFIRIYDSFETIRMGTKLAFWGKKKKKKTKKQKQEKDQKNKEEVVKAGESQKPTGEDNKNNEQDKKGKKKKKKKKGFGSIFSSIFGKKKSVKKAPDKQKEKSKIEPVVAKPIEIKQIDKEKLAVAKEKEQMEKVEKSKLETKPKELTIEEKLAKICPEKSKECPKMEPDIKCVKEVPKKEYIEEPTCKKPESVKLMALEKQKAEEKFLKTIEEEVKAKKSAPIKKDTETKPTVESGKIELKVCQPKVKKVEGLGAPIKKIEKSDKVEMKNISATIPEKDKKARIQSKTETSDKKSENLLVVAEKSTSPLLEPCTADQKAKMAKQMALKEKEIEDKIREKQQASFPKDIPCKPFIIDTAYLMSPYSLKFDSARETYKKSTPKTCPTASNFERALKKEKELFQDMKRDKCEGKDEPKKTFCFIKSATEKTPGAIECNICKKFEIIDSPPKVKRKKPICRQAKCGKKPKTCSVSKKKSEYVCVKRKQIKQKNFCGKCEKPKFPIECVETKIPKTCATYKKTTSCFKSKKTGEQKIKRLKSKDIIHKCKNVKDEKVDNQMVETKKVDSEKTERGKMPPPKIKLLQKPQVSTEPTCGEKKPAGPRCPKKDAIKDRLLPVPPAQKKTAKAKVFAIIDDAYRKQRIRKCHPRKKTKCIKKLEEIKVVTACEQKVLDAKKKAEKERLQREQEAKAKAYKELVHTVWKPANVQLDDHLCCKKPPPSTPKHQEAPGSEERTEDHVVKPDLGVKYQSPRYRKFTSSDCSKPSCSPSSVVENKSSNEKTPKMSRCLPLYPIIKNPSEAPKDEKTKEKKK